MDYTATEIGAFIVTSGVAGWIGNVVLKWMETRGVESAAQARAELDIETHRDQLTFQLLDAARIELSQLRDEVSRLRPLEGHLLHFEQALNHLERLLLSPRDDPNRQSIEDDARAFVNRMRRHAEAAGTIRNEIQRVESSTHVVRRLLEKDEGK